MHDAELQRLLVAWLDGRLTEDESATLQKELRENAGARAAFREWTRLDAALRERAERVPQFSQAPVPQSGRPAARWPGVQALGWLAAAACIAVMAIVWPKQSTPPSAVAAIEGAEATSNGCAMLSETLNAAFADASKRAGDTLKPGIFVIREGLAQIEFFSGATVLLEGAGEIEIVSAWEARCISGRLRVHVPPAAKGFLLHAPGMSLEDLGTEFALNVDASGQTSAVHVFEGEVIAHPKAGNRTSLTEGMGLSRNVAGESVADKVPQDFLAVGQLQDLVRERQHRRYEAWQAWSKDARKDIRLIAYYTFKHWPDDRWDRLINNFAEPRQRQRAGGAVGARWTQGRWPEKEALEFKRPGDRVRINLDGTYSALTLACWVKVDSVDKKYNSLLLTDGYEVGEPHWQIYEDGSLMFSIAYPPESGPVAANRKRNQMYYSTPVFTADSLGRWHHLAVTYENATGAVVQYFDGREVGREISAMHQPGRAIVFGPCEIGNWGLPTPNHNSPIRNLNGAIDEFAIYSEALSSAEIYSMFTQGKPE